MATRRTRKSTAAGIAAAAGLLAGLVALPAQATRSQQACAPPHAPIVYAATYPQQEPVPSVPGTDVFGPAGEAAGPIDPAPSSTFERFESGPQPAVGLGDLDGDGKDEYAVTFVDTVPGHALDATFVINGALPPGTYDPADVGLQIGRGFVVPMGDRDGDGLVEFATTGTALSPAEAVVLHDGAAVGAAMGVLPADGRSIGVLGTARGVLLGVAAIDESRPTLVVFEGFRGSDILFHLLDEDGDVPFTTAPHPALFDYVGPPQPKVLTGPGGTYLIYSPADRSGAAWYLWRVDDPCGSLPTNDTATTSTVPVTTQPSTATPATPVRGGATYTG